MIKILNYKYTDRVKADKSWCDSSPKHDACSPAFEFCLRPFHSQQCDTTYKFGSPDPQYQHKDNITFSAQLSSKVTNPLEFTLKQWQQLMVISATVTDQNYNPSNLIDTLQTGNRSRLLLTTVLCLLMEYSRYSIPHWLTENQYICASKQHVEEIPIS
ncbi:unnamed protein product [Trichobilharzia szidati]|nr:unnamed protein product [Trichobilharzia szidati]